MLPLSRLQPSFTLLVLRCADLPASLAFYRAVGLEFVEEQHGNGPVHFAATVGELVIELYPTLTNGSACDPARLGFAVQDLQDVLARIAALGVSVLSPLRVTRSGRRAVLQDPDGRAVEMVEG